MLQVAEENGLVGMSVLAMCKGAYTDEFYTGMADIKREVAVKSITKFRVASISKHVTALGLLKLWESGNFTLDDDVSKALNFTLRNPNFPNVPITYRMLLSHQSSIVQGSKYDKFLSDTYNVDPAPGVDQLLTPGGQYYSADIWLNK